MRKHNFFFQNFQLQTPLTRKILLTQRNDLYRRVPLVEYYQNPLSKVPIIFWNKTPPSYRGNSGCVIQCILQCTLPETPSRGVLIPEMIQVCDYDILIVLVELNTLIYVRPLNEWQILELWHFEVGNFGKKYIFLTTGGVARATFKNLNESLDHKLFLVKF